MVIPKELSDRRPFEGGRVGRRAKRGRTMGSQRRIEPSRPHDGTPKVGNPGGVNSARQSEAKPAQASSDNLSPPKTAATPAPVGFHAAWRGLIKGPLRRRLAAAFVLFALILGGLNAAVTNVKSVDSLFGWLPRAYDVVTPWLNAQRDQEAVAAARAREIRLVESLRVGVLETRLKALLGEPDYHENIGRYNRSLWTRKLQGKPVAIVQSYADQDQNLVMLSITTLRTNFTPKFSWLTDNPNSQNASVTLGKTLIANVGGFPNMLCARQSNEGAYLYVGNAPAHADNFHSHIVGVQNGPFMPDFSPLKNLPSPAPLDFRPYESLDSLDGMPALFAQKDVHNLIATSVADTYAVTAPRQDLAGNDFQVFSLPWIGNSIMSLLLS